MQHLSLIKAFESLGLDEDFITQDVESFIPSQKVRDIVLLKSPHIQQGIEIALTEFKQAIYICMYENGDREEEFYDLEYF